MPKHNLTDFILPTVTEKVDPYIDACKHFENDENLQNEQCVCNPHTVLHIHNEETVSGVKDKKNTLGKTTVSSLDTRSILSVCPQEDSR